MKNFNLQDKLQINFYYDIKGTIFSIKAYNIPAWDYSKDNIPKTIRSNFEDSKQAREIGQLSREEKDWNSQTNLV